MDYINYFCEMPSFLFYTNDKEYRNAIRKIFQMDTSKICPYANLKESEIDLENMDSISKDEVHYDMKQMDIHLDCIFQNTKNEPLFMDLYKKAATTMISEDPLIGQVVLCSYDYFMNYYSSVWFYLNGGIDALKQSIEYARLIELLK